MLLPSFKIPSHNQLRTTNTLTLFCFLLQLKTVIQAWPAASHPSYTAILTIQAASLASPRSANTAQHPLPPAPVPLICYSVKHGSQRQGVRTQHLLPLTITPECCPATRAGGEHSRAPSPWDARTVAPAVLQVRSSCLEMSLRKVVTHKCSEHMRAHH